MALGSYICLIVFIKQKHPPVNQRNIRIAQGELFKYQTGGV